MKPTFFISCPVDTYSGYGARSRDVVKAIIEMDKYDVKIIPQRWGDTAWGFLEEHEEWSYLLKYFFQPPPNQPVEKPDIWMQITIPNEFMPNGHYNIGMTAGIESTVAPMDWIQGCGRMNLILGSSKHSIDILKGTIFDKRDERTQQIIEKIEFNPNTKTDVLFEGFNEDTYKKTNEILDLPEIRESFCFLFVGHWMQGDFGHDRKNVGVLVKSFLETFKNKTGATPALILKTTGGNSSYMDKYQILKKLKDIKAQVKGKLPKIYLVHGDLTNEEMNQLYNHPKVKCMVNTTKGEGFGRPLLEFTQAKKPIITTGWSGHIDFLKPDMSVLLPGVLNEVHPSAQNKWLIQGSKWFDVDIIALNKALKDMYKNYKQWVIKAKQQGNFAKENFSYTKMKDKFEEILNELDIKAAPKKVDLKLPNLTSNNPKLKLPKLQKI